VIADAADLRVPVAVPVLCLVEAYRILEHDEHAALGPLRAHASVLTIPVELTPDDSAAMVGSMARATGRLGCAHAVFTAMAHGAAIVTSQPDQVRTIVGDGWPLIEV
jgi:hypothetical protein